MKLVSFTKMGSNGLGAGEVFINPSEVFAIHSYDLGYGIGSTIESTKGQSVNVTEHCGTVAKKIDQALSPPAAIDKWEGCPR